MLSPPPTSCFLNWADTTNVMLLTIKLKKKKKNITLMKQHVKLKREFVEAKITLMTVPQSGIILIKET